MDFDRRLANTLAGMGNGTKIIHGNVAGNVSPDIEWIKWLSYEPDFEKERMEYLFSKKVTELSSEEFDEISRYSRNKTVAELFKVYGTSECSKEDYMRVYDFMCSESITKLMLSKLTPDELKYAKSEIDRLSNVSQEELSSVVWEGRFPEKYQQLSMADSYVLHLMSDVNYNRSMADLHSMLNAQIKANDILMNARRY